MNLNPATYAISKALVDRRRQDQPPPLLILGAGAAVESGCPTLAELVRRISARAGRPDLADNPAVMQEYVGSRSGSMNDLFSQLWADLSNVTPSSGYSYLATLIADGLLDMVVTLNFDRLLENSLASQQIDYLRLVRGEHSDDFIAEALRLKPPRVKMLKLHGDLHSRTYKLSTKDLLAISRQLEDTLSQMLRSNDVIVCGLSGEDLDVLRLLVSSGLIWYVAPVFPGPNSPAARLLVEKAKCSMILGENGKFDCFFRELALGVRAEEVHGKERERGRHFASGLRQDIQTIDLNYSDTLIRRFALEIEERCSRWSKPTLLVYIHDPDAAGGTEVEKRIIRYFNPEEGRGPDGVRIVVKGDGIRWVGRHAAAPAGGFDNKKYAYVVILDSISFTGNTLRLAGELLSKQFPGAEQIWAVLVASQYLVDNLAHFGLRSDQLVSVFVTKRHDIFFPWGWTQATGTITRELGTPEISRTVQVIPRPWGTMESIAANERSSVRLHTIRAGHRMSFQRHFLRNELFLAIDDKVGVEFESEDGQVVEAALVSQGQYFLVPFGVKHRLCAHRDAVRVLEIAIGYYDQKYDIERFADDYGRVGLHGDV